MERGGIRSRSAGPFGKKWQCDAEGRRAVFARARRRWEKQEHLPAFVVFALDDFVTGDASLREQF
jgi:hypothetical protein